MSALTQFLQDLRREFDLARRSLEPWTATVVEVAGDLVRVQRTLQSEPEPGFYHVVTPSGIETGDQVWMLRTDAKKGAAICLGRIGDDAGAGAILVKWEGAQVGGQIDTLNFVRGLGVDHTPSGTARIGNDYLGSGSLDFPARADHTHGRAITVTAGRSIADDGGFASVTSTSGVNIYSATLNLEDRFYDIVMAGVVNAIAPSGQTIRVAGRIGTVDGTFRGHSATNVAIEMGYEAKIDNVNGGSFPSLTVALRARVTGGTGNIGSGAHFCIAVPRN